MVDGWFNDVVKGFISDKNNENMAPFHEMSNLSIHSVYRIQVCNESSEVKQG